MVHFAVSSMFFHGYPVDEGFDHITEAGFDSIEFWMETPYFWTRGCPFQELADCVARHPSLALTVHAPVLDLNPCSLNPLVAEASRHYAREALELAERIGATVVTLHPGRRTVKRVPSRQEYVRFGEYIDTVRRCAKGKRVSVSMENMEPAVNALLCTPESVRNLMDAEPWLHFTLDTSHAQITSQETVYRYIELCGKRLANVHLSRTDKGQRHLPLNGDEEGKKIIRFLKDRGYQGHLTIEVEDRNFDHDLTLEERMLLLCRELEYVRNSWG
ncbi:MAG: sugar phosphate isomerase/epimerase [Methanomicrobiales archaeon]|nr:sugar phosphate isomerase/epimerase [Methanomicrobiales archaeon]